MIELPLWLGIPFIVGVLWIMNKVDRYVRRKLSEPYK